MSTTQPHYIALLAGHAGLQAETQARVRCAEIQRLWTAGALAHHDEDAHLGSHALR
ncbi:hypothetical protein VP1G_11031 [Cytospora mali]|uniref:Uncharacterized protein n=1 Tax=Cytospora mali TaxID=578113 RepID=A0A194V4E9_CYTMA|nr:hypothetical protein VP1G_11031 [Valsa mali var. pyri (nom. inval.)]